ncbi:hypothetical protein G6F46_013873 [Rhizopus delemar]|nr:hypothetical protein G6F46_013873 [Rhizopus delemar]
MRSVQFNQVGTGTHLQSGGHAQRLRTAVQCALEQEAPGAAGGIRGQLIAPAQGQALAVFEQAQLFSRVDQHIGIGTDAEATAFASERLHREQAIAQVGLGDRAQAGHGLADYDGCALVIGDVATAPDAGRSRPGRPRLRAPARRYGYAPGLR